MDERVSASISLILGVPEAQEPVMVGSEQCQLLVNQKTAGMKQERLNAATRVIAATFVVLLWTETARVHRERSPRPKAGECEV